MKRNFPVYLDDDTREALENVADAAHTSGGKYAALILSEYAQLKPEFALKALGLIPAEWKHRRPGRPTTASRSDGEHRTDTVQNVA